MTTNADQFADLGGLFPDVAPRAYVDPNGYEVTWATVRARCISAYLKGYQRDEDEPPEDPIDRVIRCLLDHGAMPTPIETHEQLEAANHDHDDESN